jgi:hypothetical protein
MDQEDRDARDAAGVGPYARELEQLVALSTLNSWRVADGEPDIRGWEVQTVSNRQLGTVRDLLIDASAGEVVLIDVDLSGTDKHALVPIRVVQIDRARRVILMDSADLPAVETARATLSTPAERRTADAGTVRYPRTDREVVVQRSPVADTRVGREPRISPDDVTASPNNERRRAERRVIHRISTDI